MKSGPVFVLEEQDSVGNWWIVSFHSLNTDFKTVLERQQTMYGLCSARKYRFTKYIPHYDTEEHNNSTQNLDKR